jgi:hypothetical protein
MFLRRDYRVTGIKCQITRGSLSSMLGTSTKLLLTIEVVVAFAPSLVLLLFGILLLPVQIYALFTEPLIWQGPVYVMGSVAFGIVGLFTLALVLIKLFRGADSIHRPTLVCAGMTLGIMPIVPYAVFGDSWGWNVVGILPLAVSAHVLFLSRRLIFPSWKETRRSIIVVLILAFAIPLVLILNPFATSRNTVRDQSVYWQRVAPNRYEYTVQLSGWVEPEALNPKRITVENGAIVSASYLWDGFGHAAGSPAPIEGLWTMDRAFAELAAAQDRGGRVSARFDEQWGFVEKAFVDPPESSSGWELEVRDFRESAGASSEGERHK